MWNVGRRPAPPPRALFTALCAAAFLLLPSVVCAQSSNASLVGAVRDSTGAPLEDVEVSALESATGLDYRTRTSAAGRYWLPALPPGLYDVRAARMGLTPVTRRGIRLHVGRQVELDFLLGMLPVQMAGIEVTAAPPLIATTQSDVSYVLDQERIAMMPQESRRFLDLAQMAPGANSGLDESGLGLGVVAIGGLGSRSVGVLLDGADVVADASNTLSLSPPLLAIQEFEVVSSSYAAEYGGSASGVVNAATRRGTNRFEAEGFGLFRDQALTARGPFESEKPEYKRSHWGAAVGGPVVRDRTHYFAAYERRDENRYATVNTGGLFPAEEGTFRVPFHDNLMFARVDHRFSEPQQLTASFTGQAFDALSEVGQALTYAGGIGALSHAMKTTYHTYDGLVRHRWGPGPRTLNEARIHYLYNTSHYAPTGSGPCLEYPSIAMGAYPYEFVWHSWQVDFHEDFSHELQGWGGSHRLKAGLKAGWRYTRVWGTWFKNGLFLFESDTSSVPIMAWVGVDEGNMRNENGLVGAYVQDEWTPRPGLTLSLGVRYDVATRATNPGFRSPGADTLPFLPQGDREADLNNVAPRLGFAWDVTGKGRTVLRGGAGIFYDHQASMWSWYEGNSRLMTIVWDPGTTDVSQLPIDYHQVPLGLAYCDDRMATPMSWQASLGVEHALWSDLILRVDGVFMNASNVPVTRSVQTYDAEGNPRFAGYAYMDNMLNRGQARARMLIAQLRKGLPHGRAELTYTLARRELMQDPLLGYAMPQADPYDFDFDSEMGPAAWDERHRLVAAGELDLPMGLGAAVKVVYNSARPYNVVTGGDDNGDTWINDRPPGVGRNSERGPDYFSVDLGLRQWLKTQRGQVALVANVYNLLNRTNFDSQSVVGTIGSPLFGSAQSALAKRQFELGVQVRF